jgi:hypothetical protein
MGESLPRINVSRGIADDQEMQLIVYGQVQTTIYKASG